MAITQVNGRLSSFRPPVVVITKDKRCIICPSHSTGIVRGWKLDGFIFIKSYSHY